MRARWAIRALKFAGILIVAATLLGFAVMGLWNWLAPAVFGAHIITFWQALGILILSKILFGGLRPGLGHRGQWRHRMQERWAQMTPEEREKFRQGLGRGCRRFGAAPEQFSDPTRV